MDSVSIPTTPVLSFRSMSECMRLWIKFPPFLSWLYLTYIYIGKPIINSEELLILPWFLEPLWLMCLPPLSIIIQLFHSLFVLGFFMLSWYHSRPTLLYNLLENLTLNYLYFILEFNDDIPFRQIWCTGYLFAYSRLKKRACYDEPKFILISLT